MQRLGSLFRDHFQFVWRTLRRLGVPADVVDDCAQQVFLVVSDRLDEIATEKERSFLMGTAIRVAANARRAGRRRPEQADDTLVERAHGSPDAEELVDRKRRRELLDAALGAMTLDLRTTFVLFEIEGMTMAEIAELLDVPAGTIASRLRRAREAFVTQVERLRPRSASEPEREP